MAPQQLSTSSDWILDSAVFLIGITLKKLRHPLSQTCNDDLIPGFSNLVRGLIRIFPQIVEDFLPGVIIFDEFIVGRTDHPHFSIFIANYHRLLFFQFWLSGKQLHASAKLFFI